MPKRKVSFIWERKLEVTGSTQKNQVPWHWVMSYKNTHAHEHTHQYIQFASINSLIYCVCFYVCGHAISTGYVWRSEEIYGSQFSAYTMWNPRVKPTSLGLEAGTFTGQAILPYLNTFYHVFLLVTEPGPHTTVLCNKASCHRCQQALCLCMPCTPVRNFKRLRNWMNIFDLGSEHYASVYCLGTKQGCQPEGF